PRTVISAVRPTTPDRRCPAKATAGQTLRFSANVFADGHDVVAARVRVRAAARSDDGIVPLRARGNDLFDGETVLDDIGPHRFEIDAWVDRHATWRHRIEVKLAAGQDVTQELEEGALLISGDLDRVPSRLAVEAADAVTRLRDVALTPAERAAPALAAELAAALSALPDRAHTTTSGPWPLWVDRIRGAVGSWYELFPRSYGGLQGAAKRLHAVAEMGFDVV